MRKLISRMSGGQKGFTLIELLVVIAILGVIAAIVALNVGTFFGRGTLQAANTELHQVQTAIISLMADAETGTIYLGGPAMAWWPGGAAATPTATRAGVTYNASDYVYGPFRASYLIDTGGNILWAVCDPAGTNNVTGAPTLVPATNPWSGIRWSDVNRSWEAGTEPTTP